MSRKHAELEREFIDELPSRTGRSLDAWMAAIKAAGLTEKNAIIDWLRPQGLTFAHASWLERIHNNGGRPIYLGAALADPPRALPPVPSSVPLALPVKKAPVPASVAPVRVQQAEPLRPLASPVAAGTADLGELLLRAKGLRPLAEMLLREFKTALPSVQVSARGDLISLANPREFSVILPGPRELRLGLSLADATSGISLVPARIPGSGAQITHMLLVNDARQVGPELIDIVQRASSHVNGG